MLLPIVAAWTIAFAPAATVDERCRTPTQWRVGTPRRHCAFTEAPDWGKRSRALTDLRVANWTMIVGASIVVLGAGFLLGGFAANARVPNGRGDEPTFIISGAALMGIGGVVTLLGGVWRLGLDRRHRKTLRGK